MNRCSFASIAGAAAALTAARKFQEAAVEDFGAGPPEIGAATTRRAAREARALLAMKTIGPATGHNYHNGAHANKLALERALDALRKIALNHPCDLHDRIAALAIEDVETLRAGRTPPRRDFNY